MADAFDQAAAAFGMMAATEAAGPGQHWIDDNTLLTVADPAKPQQIVDLGPARRPPQLRTTIRAQGDQVSVQRGGDPFELEAARYRFRQAAEAGQDVLPNLRELDALGLPSLPEPPPYMPTRPKKLLGADIFGRGPGVEVDYPTWLKVRRQWQIDNPTDPLPADLQVFNFLDVKDEAGNVIPIDQVQKFAAANQDRELLHSEDMIQEARQRWTQRHGQDRPIPEVLQGTQEQRTEASLRADIQRLRHHYGPAAAELSDAELVKLHDRTLEADARRLVHQAVRKQLAGGEAGRGNAEASDDEIDALVARNPKVFQEAIAAELMPKAIDEARYRMTRRQLLGGPLAGDTPDLVKADAAILQQEKRQHAGRMASGRTLGVFPTLGELEHWANAYSMGLIHKVSQLTGSEHQYILEGYAQQHPYSALIASTLGYLTPGLKASPASGAIMKSMAAMTRFAPAPIAGRVIGRVLGQPMKEGLAGLIGSRSLGEARAAMMGAPVEGTFAKASILTRFSASSLKSAVEMPVFTSVGHAVAGEWKQALRALNAADPETQRTIAAGMILGPALEVGIPELVFRPIRGFTGWLARGYRDKSIDQLAGEWGLNEGEVAALKRVSSADVYRRQGIETPEAIRRAGIEPGDYQLMARIRQKAQAKAAEAERVADSAPPRRKVAAVVRDSARRGRSPEAPPTEPAEPPVNIREVAEFLDRTLADRPERKQLLAPRDAAIARARWLADKYSPPGSDGRRRFPMPFYDKILQEQEEVRDLIDQLSGKTTAKLPVIQQRRAIEAAIARLDEAYANAQSADEARKLRPEAWPEQGPGGRKLPEVGDLGQPQWKPKLSSMTAARGRAAGLGIVKPGVTLSKTTQVPTAHVFASGQALDEPKVGIARRKLAPGESSQADAVPPAIVARLANGGYQVLDGDEQIEAARRLGLRQVPVIVAEGAAAPKPARKPEPTKPTGIAPRSMPKDKAAWREGLLRQEWPEGALLHGTDARNLEFIARGGLQPSGLSGNVDAELVPAGGKVRAHGLAISYAVGRAKELPVVLILKPSADRGPGDGGPNARVAGTAGKSYVAAEDIQAVRFPDGTELPLREAVAHYQRLREQLTRQIPEKVEAAHKAPEKPAPPPAPPAPAGPTVRAATAEDLDVLVEAQRGESKELGFLPTESLREYIGEGRVIVVETGGKPAGFLVHGSLKEPTVTIMQTWVDPAQRRGGIGRRLVEALVARAKQAGAAAIRAKVRSELEANAFWERVGFEKAGEEDAGASRGGTLSVWTRQVGGLFKGKRAAAPPALPAIEAVDGRAATIETATGEKVAAHYAAVELATLIPSHDPVTFKQNKAYPPDVQERLYHTDKEEQLKVSRQEEQFNADFVLTDNPDPVNGPPMVLKNGLVMGGNSRAMTIARRYKLGELRARSLRQQMVDAAAKFGIDPAKAQAMKEPVIVRILDEDVAIDNAARMRELVRLLQKGRTQDLSVGTDAAARARILLDNPQTLEFLEKILGDGDSIREAMASPAKTRELRYWLTHAQVFTNSEVARFTHPDTGMFSEEGKNLIEKILRAIIVPDVGLFDGLPQQIANKITGNLAALVLPMTRGADWNLQEPLSEALRAWYRWRGAPDMPVEDYVDPKNPQATLLNDPVRDDPSLARARTLLIRLVRDNTFGWRERVKAYAAHAQEYKPGQGGFGFAQDDQITPGRAFERAFEADVPIAVDGKPIEVKKGAAGLFGSGGPEKYLHSLEQLRAMLSDPEGMSLPLRRALRLPRRIIDRGFVAMSVGGNQPIDPAELLKVPEVAEHIARIATFHLEQVADAPAEKILAKWAEAVRGDVEGILKDLGYNVAPDRWADLLGPVWDQLRGDPDVRDALGELPPLERSALERSLKPRSPRRRGGGGGGGAKPPAGGGGPPAGPGPGGSPPVGDQPPAGPDVVPPGEQPGGGLPEGAVDPDGVPEWVPPAQRQDYLDALRSGRFVPYVPVPPTRSGSAHPRLLVESAALAGVRAGDTGGYEPDARAIVDLSDPQRDQVRQVGYRIHHRNAGALVADDVGVGKSRIIGGIIADQMLRARAGLSGKRRVLVLTKNRQNIADLINTFTKEMAATFGALGDVSFTNVPEQGVPRSAGDGVLLLDAFNFTRYAQEVSDWGPDLVLVDEAHLFSNLAGETARANMLQTFHERHMARGGASQGAHFVYLTATPASDIAAIQFMYGLGLWHPSKLVEADPTGAMLTFDGWLQQATGISKAGTWRDSIATPIIEQLMRELKMDNAYASLDFWRGGFEFDMRQAPVGPEQLALYDDAAVLLQDAIRLYTRFRAGVNHSAWPANRDIGAVELPGTYDELSAPPRPDGQAIFFMKRLLVEFRLPEAIKAAQEALARGDQVVFKILGVSDTHLTGEGGNLGAVLDSIPVWTAQKKGQVIQKWVLNKDAADALWSLRHRAGKLTPSGKIKSPLDQLVEAFGQGNIAQIVGSVTLRKRIEQNAEFQAGKRRVAVISAAGESGINLQDLGTGRRWMFVLDLDWDSKAFKQTLGRIDRTGQVTSPGASTFYTPIAGERKFQATIAVRMKALGAIAKGQEDAGNTDALNDFDMESSTWHRAINEVVRGLPHEVQDQLLHIGKVQAGDELSWRDFQNDLMMLPHKLANDIFDQAQRRWEELENEDRANVGSRIARRNRGLIRESTVLDEGEHPLTLHTVENVGGETYGILQGKLLTRPDAAIPMRAIIDAIGSKRRAASQMFVTMQQGERIVSGLFVPRGRIETVKALFGKASQKELFGKEGMSGEIPAMVLDKLPLRLAVLGTRPAVPPAVASLKHREDLVSRQDITDLIIRRFHVAIGVGRSAKFRRRAGGGRVLGFYSQARIRSHVANEIGILGHELGHRLAHLFNNLQPPQQFDHELIPLGNRTSMPSYTKVMRRREGEAEWFRIYMIDPDTAYARAPDYSQFFEQQAMQYPEIWEAIKQLQGLYQRYLAQDPVEQLQSQIAWEDRGPTRRSPYADEGLGQYLYRHLFDGRAPLYWMRQWMRGPDPAKPGDKTPRPAHLPDRFAQDAYVLARLNAGNRNMVHGWVKFGVRDRNGNLVAEGLDPLLRKHGISRKARRKEFESFLVALRVKELYTQAQTIDPLTGRPRRELKDVVDEFGGPLGITKEQAEATIQRYDSPAFRAAADGVHRWSRAVLETWAKTSGAFEPGQIEAIIRLNQQYVPLHVVLDRQAAGVSRGGGGPGGKLVDRFPRFHRILGSGRSKLPPLATLIRNTVRLVETIEANRAAIKAFEMLRGSDRGGLWADKIARPIRGITGTIGEIKRALIEAGADPADFDEGPNGEKPKIDPEALFTIFRPIQHNPAEMEVALKIGGKIHLWQVHVPALYEALTGQWRQPTNNLLLRVLMAATTMMKRGFTLPLEFILGNVQRDTATASIQSRYGYKPLHLNPLRGDFLRSDFFIGLWHTIRKTPQYQLFLQSKAGSAPLASQYHNELEREIRDLGVGKGRRFLSGLVRPWRWLEVLEAISIASDNATRVGEFVKALAAEGVDEEGLARAGLAARDVTVDFARGGEWSRQIGQWRAFFGAALQGPDTLVRNFRHRPWEMLVRAVGGITLLSLLLHYLSRDNPDYQERVKERQLYWLIPLGNPRTTRKWMRIRKPHEIGLIFGSLAEALYESTLAKDPKMLRDWIPDDRTAFEMLMDLMPTAVVPALEVAFNYDTFRQRQIVPEYAQDLEPDLQYTRYTSQAARLIGRALGVSPAKIDHLVYGYLGTLGRSTVQIADDVVINPLLRQTGQPQGPARGGIEQDLPGLRIFFAKDLSPNSAQSVAELFDMIRRLKVVENTLKGYSGQERDRYERQNRDVLLRRGVLHAAEQRMRVLKRDIDAVYEDARMSPQEKRRRLAGITTEMINVARDVFNKPQVPKE